MQKTKIKFEKFTKALAALEAIYLHPITEDRVNIDATIQRFEFTFELCWKFLKDYLQEQGLNLNYPKEVIKEAFASGIISNEDVWLNMLSDRNLTSHSYDQTLADQIYLRIKDYVPELKQLLVAVSQNI
jgi:nucleotidyltransferase substrate binding protein (TIGR01987 family)